MNDPFNLSRFLEAQDSVFVDVLSELRAGRKRTHWMWFVFPQIRGLGRSPMSERFAINSLQEAEAYLAHPILGPRLRECTQLVSAVEGRAISQIFGNPDDMKFRSCMTLFAGATSDNKIFQDALEKYFGGKPDPMTMELIER